MKPSKTGHERSRRPLASAADCLMEAAESIDDGLVVMDAQGRILHLNRAMRALADRLLSPSTESARHSETDPLQALLNPDGELSGPYEMDVPAAGGGMLTLNVSPAALTGPAARRVLLVRDVTAERAERAAVYALIGQVAHELRSPLQHIRSYTDLLRELDDLTAEQRTSFLEVIEDEAHRLGLLIDDLLQMARYEQGRMQVKRRPTLLSAVVSGVVAKHNRRAAAKGIGLVDEVERGIWVEADSLRFEQVLSNLLSNALRYVPAGGEVRVVLQCVDGHAETRVIDDGPGMPPETLKRIFEPFFQGAEGITSGAGAGLGLSISKQLMDAMGGSITVESCVSRGSVFVLRMPAVPPRSSD